MNRLGAVMVGGILMGVGLLFRFNAEDAPISKSNAHAIADVANILILVGLATIVAGLIALGKWSRNQVD